MNRKNAVVGILLLIVAGLYSCNSATLALAAKNQLEILAHRGLHQTYSPVGIARDTCTASRIDQPVHGYIENTIPSIQAALDLGADMVEFDIHSTVDGEFVVFHDWTLECRTNGKGVTRKQTLKYLKSLDIGYGYTADEGNTYPLRGKYIGAMPTLGEVLTIFPKAKFLINIKSNDVKDSHRLTRYLNAQQHANRERLLVYGSGKNIPVFAALNPDIVTFSKQQVKSCLTDYVMLGWSGHVSADCRNGLIMIPQNYRWLIWGWPSQFEARLRQVNSRVMLMGPYKKGQAISGVDHPDDVPENFGGIVFTNRIDLMGDAALPQAE